MLLQSIALALGTAPFANLSTQSFHFNIREMLYIRCHCLQQARQLGLPSSASLQLPYQASRRT